MSNFKRLSDDGTKSSILFSIVAKKLTMKDVEDQISFKLSFPS